MFTTCSQSEYSNLICRKHFAYNLVVVINADSIYLSIRNLQEAVKDKTFKFLQR